MRLRTQTYVVEGVEPTSDATGGAIARLSWLDDAPQFFEAAHFFDYHEPADPGRGSKDAGSRGVPS